MDGQKPNRDDELKSDAKSISVDFRDLGRWEHDEESHSDDQEEEDDSWREDDDQMVWAVGQHTKYMAKFETWAKTKPWYSKVKLEIHTSEKNWCSFTVTLK